VRRAWSAHDAHAPPRRFGPTGTLRRMSDLDALALQIHTILRMAPGSAPDHRALHAKGIVATGSFVATGALAGRTTAAHLVEGTTPATVRFSHPGGDPLVSDTVPSARGMAVKLRAPGGTHDLVTVTSPAFLARDGAAFVELLLARAPDPETGAPDPARMGAFIEAHPESLPAIEAVLTAKVAASYATLAYNSLHTFFLVNDADVRTPVRFTWTPVAGVAHLEDASDRDADFLAGELADRLATAPAAFDLVVHLGTDDDPTDDPTAIWPERPTVVAGRLELRAIDPDTEPIIFDPTNVPAGVELPPGDEILALRRLVYGHSYAQRTA
jgi:catalase